MDLVISQVENDSLGFFLGQNEVAGPKGWGRGICIQTFCDKVLSIQVSLFPVKIQGAFVLRAFGLTFLAKVQMSNGVLFAG